MTDSARRVEDLTTAFGEHTTAAEVLDGLDLTGRTAVVTGGYSGIGLEVVRALSAAGARVLAPARRPEAAVEALAGIDRVEVGPLDLADQADVAAYADGLLAAGDRVDLLVLNAGIMACPETRVGPGWELQMATNHLGHFALVNRLWPLLAGGPRPARVVSVSSAGHQFSPIRWDDPWLEDGYDAWLAYGQSKTANILLAVHLDAVGQEHGVRAFALHPGAIITPLGRHLTDETLAALVAQGDGGELAMPAFKSPEAGAATVVWAACSPELEGRGGLYLEDCGVAPTIADDETATSGVRPRALDMDEAARLWAWSAEQTGLDALS